MKKHAVSLWSGVSVLLLTMGAAAQAVNNAVATVPFDFVAGKKQFSAGTYNIVSRGHLVSLRDQDGRLLANLGSHLTQVLDTPAEAKLVFYDVDGKHFLARVWFAGDNQGAELIRPGTETEVAKKFAAPDTMRAASAGSSTSGK